jgi:hypothetical protein
MAKDSIELRSQRQNANRHSQRGMGMLERSVQQGGWIGAITAAADGEVFDGSLRLESALPLMNGEPIIVRSDGTRPIIHIREDIPSADDPQAKLLSVAANRVAEVSLNWDAPVLEEWQAAIGLDDYWLPDEPKPWEAEIAEGMDDEDDDDGDRVDGDKYPLPIVLSWAEQQRWNAIKGTLGLKSDKRAFLEMCDRVEVM